MTTARIKKLIKAHGLQNLNLSLLIEGRIMFAEPVGSVLRGFYFEDSSFNKDALYVSVFVQPLYVPRKFVHFTFGRRLIRRDGRRSELWEFANENDRIQGASLLAAIEEDGLPYLQRLGSPALLAENLPDLTGRAGEYFTNETIAYSLAKCLRYSEATTKLEALVQSVRPSDPWHELTDHAKALLQQIVLSPDAVPALLERWESETARIVLPSYTRRVERER